jgi:siroheme synthase-like protein
MTTETESKNISLQTVDDTQNNANPLFPVFLQLNNLRLLIVGGGLVALEKLNAVLANSPHTAITLVSLVVNDEIYALQQQYVNLNIIQKEYDANDLHNADVVIVAVNNIETATQIRNDAKQRRLLVNVADKPELCDFYLSSIVSKGNLKVAISTNGKSPTIAKRVKELLAEVLPGEIDEVLNNMQTIRDQLKGDFANKVTTLNELTKVLVAKKVDLGELKSLKLPKERTGQKIVKWCLFAFVFMIIGSTIISYFPFHSIVDSVKTIPHRIDTRMFVLMVLTGFLAQMADGSLGMGYGTISTVFLLAIGVPPAIVSSRVHSARVFSSGVSGYSHHRFGNINKKLFKALVVPGIIGAIAGAAVACFFSKSHPQVALWVRFVLTFYTAYLGYYIIRKAFIKKKALHKVKRAGWLASAGGFMDAFAGGGWGALVTSTLIAKRKDARYVIGSVCLAEFFVVLASAITFFILLENLPIVEIIGLILGGMIAAPIAARFVGKLPLKTMYIVIGSFVVLTSAFTLWNVVHKIWA